MRSARIKQEFYLVFVPYNPKECLTLWERVQFWFMARVWDRGKVNRDDFGHVFIFLKKRDMFVCVTQTRWGYYVDVERMGPNASLVMSADDVFTQNLKREYPKANAIVKVQTNICPKDAHIKTINNGRLCHHLACNVLGIKERVKSPFLLYDYLVKRGYELILGYKNG